ncbi:MAG: hypothetical protein ACXADD_16640 [Candidatus Thorarchaeota archaeon]|jgi:hypothetical protein
MNESELFECLKSYAEFVVSEISKWERENRIHRIPTPVYLDQEHPEEVEEYRAAVQVIHRNHWDYQESESFLRYVLNSPMAKKTMNAIINFPPKNRSMLTYLFNFTQSILDSIIGIVKFKPSILSRNLASSLAGSPISRHLIAKIHGVEVKEPIKLRRGVVLRPAIKSDLDWEGKGYMSPFYENILWGSPDSIIEINTRKKNLHTLFYRLFHILRLYRPYPIGSSHAICWSASPIDRCRPQSSSLYVGNYLNTHPRYHIYDAVDVTGYIGRYLPLLPDDWIDFNIRFNNPLNIAYNRYLEALQNYQRRERAITFSVMGLEALILEQGPELKHRFRSRLARLSSYLDLDSKDVYKILNQAYSIRSDFVHGNVTKQPRKNEKLCLETSLSLLQICILIYLSNGPLFKKKQFLEYIDNAIIGLDEDGETKMVEIIEKYKETRYRK